MIDICTELFDNEYIAKIKNILMSNDTITRRIHFMADDIENKLIQKNKKSIFYATQIDKSTDVNNEPTL